MNLVISDENGKALKQIDDFDLDYQYGQTCDFELELPELLQPHYRVHIDGTSIGCVIDTPCPTHNDKGSSIRYKGRNFQGVLQRKVIMPKSNQTHYTYTGEANAMIAEMLEAVGADDIFCASAKNSGINLDGYKFNRFINAWDGLRMALATQDAMLKLVCQEGKHEWSAVPCREYGRLDSEKVYFSLECEMLPVNHLIGLGKGEGLARAVSHWYADLFGNVSQTQTLFGVWENAMTYSLNSEEAATLPAKTKAKLLEYQEGSPATVSLPDDPGLDINDRVFISDAEYGLEATTQVVGVVFKHKNGIGKTEYDFGVPNYPEEEE